MAGNNKPVSKELAKRMSDHGRRERKNCYSDDDHNTVRTSDFDPKNPAGNDPKYPGPSPWVK